VSTPAAKLTELCPRCHQQSLVEVRDQAEVLRPVACEDGHIALKDVTKEVIVRVCSIEKCGYRSDDA
jgi:hypothetical protein